jgi:hypothetical protein
MGGKMKGTFQSALTNLRGWEGFKDNDPDDPGGETQYGISRHYHPEMWVNGNPPSWPQAEVFYHNLWVDNGCNDLPSPVDWIHFDSCVNPGPSAAKQFLMFSAEHKIPNRQAVEYALLRIRYYIRAVKKRPVSLKYLAGWTSRTLDFLERSVINSWDMEVL